MAERKSRTFRCLIGAVAASSLAIGLLASAAAAGGTQGQVPTSAQKGYTSGLPASVAALYVNAADLLGPSAYRKWKAVPTPWTLCYNSSYLGNTWRAAALTEFNTLAAQYKKAGLVTKYLSTNSNLNLPTQIQQMDDMINVDHCSGIIVIPTGTSGLNNVIDQAYNKGIAVVDDLGPTTTPYAENFDENQFVVGFDMATADAKAMGGKGNMLDVLNFPGETLSIELQSGLKAALKNYPNIHIIGQISGNATDSIAESATLQFLATHPQPIQGVFEEGGCGVGIYTAFKQEKRPIPVLNEVGSGGFTAIWHNLVAAGQHPKFYELTDSPGFCMQESFDILIRILEGQHPRNMSVFYPPPAITSQNLNQWWTPALTPSTTLWPEPRTNPLPDSMLNSYFSNGKAPLPYKG